MNFVVRDVCLTQVSTFCYCLRDLSFKYQQNDKFAGIGFSDFP